MVEVVTCGGPSSSKYDVQTVNQFQQSPMLNYLPPLQQVLHGSYHQKSRHLVQQKQAGYPIQHLLQFLILQQPDGFALNMHPSPVVGNVKSTGLELCYSLHVNVQFHLSLLIGHDKPQLHQFDHVGHVLREYAHQMVHVNPTLLQRLSHHKPLQQQTSLQLQTSHVMHKQLTLVYRLKVPNLL
ncbi:Uncharacterised protein [Acinetobacter baumannii]|nr:Uncharacterised protein [Acinetobacter baumannii]